MASKRRTISSILTSKLGKQDLSDYDFLEQKPQIESDYAKEPLQNDSSMKNGKTGSRKLRQFESEKATKKNPVQKTISASESRVSDSNGMITIPKELVLKLLQLDISQREWSFIIALILHTDGNISVPIEISYLDISRLTNIGTNKLPQVIKQIEDKRLVQRTTTSSGKNLYKFTEELTQIAQQHVAPTNTQIGVTN